MSIESAKAFLERTRDDEEWRTKLGAAGGKEERLAIVKEEGFDFTEEEFVGIKGDLAYSVSDGPVPLPRTVIACCCPMQHKDAPR